MTKEDIKDFKINCTTEEFQKLINDNMNFPYYIVNKEFKSYWSIKDELNSAAMAGMIYAASKYDFKKGKDSDCNFRSYAVHWIRYFIKNEIYNLYPIKFNQNFITKRNKVLHCIEDYKKLNNDSIPSNDYIAQQTGLSLKTVKNVLSINNGEDLTFLSFNGPTEDVNGNENGEYSSNVILNEYLKNEAVDNSIYDKLDFNLLLKELKKKVSNECFTVFKEYYIQGKTYTELAKEHKLAFPSSAFYLIKKAEKVCKQILGN